MADREVEEITARNHDNRRFAEEVDAQIVRDNFTNTPALPDHYSKKRDLGAALTRICYWMSGGIGGVSTVFAIAGEPLYAAAGIAGMLVAWRIAAALEAACN